MLALVLYPDTTSAHYTKKCIAKALVKVLPECVTSNDPSDLPDADFQLSDYDSIDFETVMKRNDRFASCYMIRKALIRKNHLALTVSHYVAKNKSSILAASVPKSFPIELAHADELEELWFDELYDLGQMMDFDTSRWWIFKPAMSDKGQGIRLFNSKAQLEAIVKEFDDSSDDESDKDSGSDEDNVGEDPTTSDVKTSTKISLSQLRHFVLQEYISRPLTVKKSGASNSFHKFHLRVYAICVSAISVYVFDKKLALFAPKPYESPAVEDEFDLSRHLTNTCLQDDDVNKEDNVRLWSDLNGAESCLGQRISRQEIGRVDEAICDITSELFKAAIGAGSNFQPLPNAFEIFGIDFVVDEDLKVHLLEVNACPDFAQTGHTLAAVIDELFEGTIQLFQRVLLQRQDPSTVEIGGFRRCLATQLRAW